MAEALLTALLVAGFLLGQVTAVKRDVSPKPISPVAFTVKGTDQHFVFLDGDTTRAKVDSAEQTLSALQLDAWAYAYEGFIVLDDEKIDAFFLGCWARGLKKPVLIAQPWRATTDGGVVLLGAPVLIERGDSLNSDQGRVPTRLAPAQEEAVQAGRRKNEELRRKESIGSGSSQR